MRMIVLLWIQMLHAGLNLNDFEVVLDREFQRGEAVIHSISSEWALLRSRDRTLLESALPATQVVDGGASMMWLRVLSIIATVKSLVGGVFYCFLQLNIQLGSIQDLTPTSDIVFHQIFVQWVSNLQPTNE